MKQHKKPRATARECVRVSIMDKLYSDAYQVCRQELRKIIRQNSVYAGNAQEWLVYKGNYYCADLGIPKPTPINRVDPRIQPEMEHYVQTVNKINQERKTIETYLAKVFSQSSNPQDWLGFLPESLHETVVKVLNHCGFYDISVPATPTKSADLTATDEHCMDLMRQRKLTNLLLR